MTTIRLTVELPDDAPDYCDGGYLRGELFARLERDRIDGATVTEEDEPEDDEPAPGAISGRLDVFEHVGADGGWWVLWGGDLHGPYADEARALAVLPLILAVTE